MVRLKILALLVISSIAPSRAYTTITAAALHQRLLNGDTLQIIDVREYGDHMAGHIGEPSGQLPLTSACMPWNSGVFQVNYARLPRNVDIVIHCQSGARAIKASAFLDSVGYTRVFNAGGFSAWTYETRTGMYGDGSGGWIHPSFTAPDTVRNDSCALCLTPSAFAGFDSVYCEIYRAYGKPFVPQDAPVSDVAGLFLLTVVDKFGLPLWSGDSLPLQAPVTLSLVPQSKGGVALPVLVRTGAAFLKGKDSGWQAMNFSYQPPTFQLTRSVLHQWYNVTGFMGSGVAAGQNFASSARDQKSNMPTKRFRLNGRLIGRLDGPPALRFNRSIACGCCITAVSDHRAARITRPQR